MATKIKIELNSAGIKSLLCSGEVAAETEKAAEAIAARAGDGFVVLPARTLGYGGGRVGYAVKADTYEAKLAEATNKTLSKAVTG